MSSQIRQLFESAGGEFVLSEGEIAERLSKVKGYVFDWDGVFNDGSKGSVQGSNFSEPDSMGLNLLRFSHYLVHGQLPYVCILTGANNPTAITFAEREHLNNIFLRFKDKLEAAKMIQEEQGIMVGELAFFYDDVLDLSLARNSVLPICMRTRSKPMFNDFVARNQLSAYNSGSPGGQGAVREVCELLIALRGNFEQVMDGRIGLSETYQTYWKLRNADPVKVVDRTTL